jgi:hypothetical protein
MATVAELEARQAELKAEERRLKVEFDAFDARKSEVLDEKSPLDRELRAQRAIITDPNASEAEKDAAVLRGTEIEQELRTISAEFRSLNDEQQRLLNDVLRPIQQELYNPITGIGAQIEQAEREARTPTGSTAAAEVGADQTTNPSTAPAESVTPDGEVVTPRATTTPTTAVATPTAESGAVTSGTDAPTRTLEQTQQVNEWSEPGAVPGVTVSDRGQAEPGAIPGVTVSDRDQADPGFNPTLSASTTAGSGSKDDNTAANTGTEQAAVNAGQTNIRTITPQDNVLDRFHNYTYSASIYVLTPEQFALYQQQPRQTISGYNLLIQSGGAATGTGQFRGSAAGRADANIQDNRNPAFPLDYYIDSIQIEHLILGRATQAAHGVTNLKFTVIEPGNISLLDNIYRAVQDLSPELAGQINYAAAVYLMVIRFYGYDLDGRPVRVGAASDESTQSDPDAVVEKFIPFRIRQINWTVSNQLVNYQIEGTAVGQIVAAATRRGTIPADIQLSGATVREMLAGDPTYSSKQAAASAPGASTTTRQNTATDPGEVPGVTVTAAPAPPKATGASNKSRSLISGLIAAVNQKQAELKGKSIDEVDEYEIEFGPGAENIADARVTKPGNKVAKDLTSGAVAVSKGNTGSASPDKQGMDVTSRNFAIPAGTQLLQAMDQIIRNSSYITDQALEVIDERTNRPADNPKVNKDSGFQWYNILMQATPLKYDAKRNDFAFRVKYVIVPYQPQDFFSQYFPVPQYRGIHKRYPYWFTGENTQVLDYQASFNKLFTITVTGGPGTNPLQAFRENFSTSMRDYPFIQTQARSTESDVGADGRANEVAANAAEYLYNPSDNAQAKIKILGDPAWIQQGSASGLAGATSFTAEPFNADGTINFDAQDVLFEVAWQRPEDYSQDTGLADPYARTQTSFQDRQPIQSVIYRARKCTSYFNQGRFEQELEGTLYYFPLPDGRNKAPATQATVRAVDNAIDAARETAPQAGDNRKTTLNDSSGSTYDLLLSSAKNQTGSQGLQIPTSVAKSAATLGSGQFTFPDTAVVNAAPPAAPPTSDGQDISTQDIAEAERINAAAGGDQITAQQVASNRRLNEALSAPFARFTDSSQQVSTQAPQDISRET